MSHLSDVIPSPLIEMSPMKTSPLALLGGRIQPDAHQPPTPRDILIGANGRIEGLFAPGTIPAGAPSTDLAGKLVVPGLVDAHQHIDKSRTIASVPNPRGDLEGAVEVFKAYATTMTREDVMARAERTLAACSARGTVAIRSHANVDPETECRGIEALVEMREKWRDRIRLQVVGFLSRGSPGSNKAREWLDNSIAAGADVIGGTPARVADYGPFLDLLFSAAERTGLPIDLHLDEHLDVNNLHFEAVIERTRAHGMQGRVVASHSCALAALAPDAAQRIIEGLAEAGIGVITLPTANLFLQGRDADRLAPRGLTRVNELAAAGVTVACGSDNIQDPFVPTGSGDMLEIARWTLLAAHLGSHELPRAFTMASINPARLMGLAADYGLREGARADLLITDAADCADLVAGGALSRVVLFGGKLVSGSL
jgi:cytosine/creatinine deaminase